MSIIDSTYFIRDINIPVSAYNDLDSYIATYEKEMLIKLLGYPLWLEFTTALAGEHPEIPAVIEDDVIITPAIPAVVADQKWIDLRDGKTYTFAGVEVRWNGLKNTDKISPIAYYVYCKYVEAKQVLQSNTGANQPKQENSTPADNVPKLVSAWNNFLNLYGYPGQSAFDGSALNFLLAHSDTYNSYTVTFQSKNIYGL